MIIEYVSSLKTFQLVLFMIIQAYGIGYVLVNVKHPLLRGVLLVACGYTTTALVVEFFSRI